MPLPVVSKETRTAVMEELGSYPGGEPDYCMEMLKKLDKEGEGKNPVIADFLFDILTTYEDKDLATYMILFGFMVYRALEITLGEGKMPKVGDHVGAPIQQEFFKNPTQYSQSLGNRIMKQNPQVPLICVDICGLKAMSDDPAEQRIPTMTMIAGLSVYRFIESQQESDEMTKSFDPAS